MSKLHAFNYAAVQDAKTRRELQEHAGEIKTLVRRTGESIIEIGRRLETVRGLLDTTTFREWLKAEFEFAPSMAWSYMQAAAKFGDIGCLEKFQPSALVTLARRNVPAAAANEAIKAAKSGQTVTLRKAKEILKRHDVQPTRKDAGQPRLPVKDDSLLPTLERVLETLAGSLDRLALSRDQRDELADRFLELALRLRTLGVTAVTDTNRTSGKVRRRAAAGAA